MFGDPNLVLHTADIVRTKNGFESLKDSTIRARFFAELNAVMRELDYSVVACVINKDEYVQEYRANPKDLYMVSLDVVAQRFCRELGNVEDGGIIFAEKRRPDLDRDLDHAWERLKQTGTGDMEGKTIEQRIVDLSLKDKQLNLAGLQLADLVISPIGRAVIGKEPREDWAIVERKFCRIGNTYHGSGLVVLPKTIRDRGPLRSAQSLS